MRKESKSKGLIGFNKFTITLVLLYFLLGVGGTYAYFAFNYENTSVIAGNVVSVNADLSVELVVGSNDYLVPLKDDAVSNAIKGEGGAIEACVDGLGRLSCQVYKITLTNNGSRLQHLVGTIELYPDEGDGNVYTNLKWRELSDATTIKSGSNSRGMAKSTLVSGLTLESKESKTWYVAVWISETDYDQRSTDKGDFRGTVTFESIEPIPNVFVETIMEPNAQSDATIDFSQTSEASVTNGIYLRSGTENDEYPIYYYRGAVDNNLIFADFCWKIVRSTETGGLKLLYNGVPADGACNNTGDASQIGKLSQKGYSIGYFGYMYSFLFMSESKTMTDITDTYIYGSDVVYVDGQYRLTGTKDGVWSSVYNSLTGHHYTCFSTSDQCTDGKVYYLHYTESNRATYFVLTDGKNIAGAIEDMLGTDEKDSSLYNKISNVIKGDKNTAGTIDYWYYNNLYANYNEYIEDTVWCNDRSTINLEESIFNGYNALHFGASQRTSNTKIPTLVCPRNIDKFTVDGENGNGALDYPVGLLTADEMMLAGGASSSNNTSFYLYSGSAFWSMSPQYYSVIGNVANTSITSTGKITSDFQYSNNGIRPAISLKNGFGLVGDGDGSAEAPYVVSY